MIEGPKNAEFQTYRQATEDEPGSDFDEDGVSGMAKFNDEGGMGSSYSSTYERKARNR